MAKSTKKTKARKEPAAAPAAVDKAVMRIRWERRNVVLMTAGLAAVAIGYVALSQGSMTLAPLLLVAGYCVLVPLAFIL